MARVPYASMVNPDSPVGQYMQMMQSIETATAYDFWGAMWILGNACGRSVYVDRPRAPVYLNWYCVFVADSGVTRKSTAVKEARNVMRLCSLPNTDFLENKSTPEGVINIMQKRSHEHQSAHLHICIPEMVTFLGRERYNMHMPGLLTDLYDCPEERVGGGSAQRRGYLLKRVFVSFLSASTLTWLERAINPDVIEGGFTSRTILVVSEHPKARIAWPEHIASDSHAAVAQRFSDVARTARNLQRISLTDGALRKFRNWYARRESHRDPYRQSFESREDDHVLRMAALLAINADRHVIEAGDITRAVRIINEVKHDGAGLFAGGVVPSKIMLGIDKTREVLIESGIEGITQAKLFAKVRHQLDSTTFNTLLALMHEQQMVQKFTPQTQTSGRPKTVWRGTTRLVEKARVDDVLKNLLPGT